MQNVGVWTYFTNNTKKYLISLRKLHMHIIIYLRCEICCLDLMLHTSRIFFTYRLPQVKLHFSM